MLWSLKYVKLCKSILKTRLCTAEMSCMQCIFKSKWHDYIFRHAKPSNWLNHYMAISLDLKNFTGINDVTDSCGGPVQVFPLLLGTRALAGNLNKRKGNQRIVGFHFSVVESLLGSFQRHRSYVAPISCQNETSCKCLACQEKVQLYFLSLYSSFLHHIPKKLNFRHVKCHFLKMSKNQKFQRTIEKQIIA